MRARLLMLLLCAVQVVPLVGQTSIGPAEVGARARAAKKVVVGNVVDVNSRYERNQFGDQLIVSDVLLSVDETLKGADVSLVTVTIEGGTIGDVTLRVSDITAVRAGDRLVAFLDQRDAKSYVPHDRGRGILKLDAANRVEGTTDTLGSVRNAVRSALR